MKVTGTIKLIQDVQQFDSGFSKRLMVVTTKETYPQDLPIEFIKDKTSLLDTLKVGQEVEVSINLRGSEWNGKYFASITGWKVEGVTQNEGNIEKQFQEQRMEEEVEDDLPF